MEGNSDRQETRIDAKKNKKTQDVLTKESTYRT